MSATPRDLIARADHQRRLAHAADGLMVTIRLGGPIILAEMKQRGPFGRKRKYLYELEDRMSGVEVEAIYKALSVVRQEAKEQADDLDARVTIADAEGVEK